MNKFITRCLSLLSFVLLTNSWGYSQLTTSTLTSTQDSYIDSRLSTNNFGGNSSMSSSTYMYGSRGGAQYYRRSFVEFDLADIPANATIYSASLDVTRTGGVAGNTTWQTKLITSSWSENSITSSIQPTISTLSTNHVETTPDPISYVDQMDVTSMVQRMVSGQIENNGWSIQVNHESYSGSTGASFWTSEHGTESYQPKLVVQYYIPLSIAAATVSHESSTGAADGSVSFTLAGGSSSSYTYTWINGATGAQISSNTSSKAVALTGQSYGWYGLHVTGTNGENFYQGFIIGQDCEEVTITYQPDNNYADNAYTFDWDTGNIDYTSTPIPNSTALLAQSWTHSGTWTKRISWLNFKLWVDDELDITQADMTLTGYNHASLTGTNESQFDIVTEGWNENYLTWDNSPTTSTSTTENVPNKTTTTANSVVDVLDFWNVWQANNTANYGMKFKLQTTTNSYRQQYYQSSSSTTESSRPKIEFKVDLTKSNFLTSSWDLDTELGEVTVDISELCDGVSPYFYYMSTDTIIDLDSLYGFFTDTIIGMDSTIFYSTSTTDLQKTFTHIVSGHYHFAVFDKNGVRLIDETLHIMDDLGFDAQTGLTVSGNEVTASAANSVGSFDLFTTEDNYSEMKIDLLGLSGIQFFGFADLDKTVSTHADLVFGYYLSGTNLYTIDAGVLSSTFVTANTSSDLDIINDRGTLKLMLDGIEHASKVVGANFVYKFGLGAQPANKIGFYPIKFASLKKKYIFTPKNLSNLTCAGDLGSFTFTVNTINTLEGFNSIFTIVHEETGNPIYTNQIALDGVAVPVTMDYLGTPLLPGVYVITIDIDGPTIPFTKKITLGYEASWKTSYQYDLPNSYSVSRSLPFDNTYSNAIAENLDKLSNGWIEFTPVVENFPWSLNQLVRFKYLNFNSTVLSSTEPYFAFFKWKSGKILMCYFDGQNFGNNIINVGDRVKVAYNNNSVSIYVEDVLWTSFATTVFDTPIGVQLLSKTGGNGYNDVITSFGCQDNLIHAKLERKMSGVKYRTVSGKLRFYYDEEYQSQETDLTYKVFGFDDRLNSVLDGVQQPYSVLYGDNRYELDITGLSDGAYILEVQNDKEEVFYLRFIK